MFVRGELGLIVMGFVIGIVIVVGWTDWFKAYLNRLKHVHLAGAQLIALGTRVSLTLGHETDC